MAGSAGTRSSLGPSAGSVAVGAASVHAADAAYGGRIAQNRGVTYYRLAPAVIARFVGLALVVAAALVFVTTVLVAVVSLGWAWIVGVLVVAVVVVAALAWWLIRRAYVVAAGPQGYHVRLVRGAGVRDAAWTDVHDAVAATSHGYQVLVLRLRDGGSTSIPVSVLRIDKEEFVRAMQRHLQAGQNVRPLG